MLPEKKFDQFSPSRDTAVLLSAKLVAIPSVTAIDPKDYPASVSCLGVFAEEARRAGAHVEHFIFEGGHEKWPYPVDNLYIEWNFGRADRHLCYMGHLDVVPPGDFNKWSVSPFGAKIADGFLYGRGVTDMKASVAAFLCAVQDSVVELNQSSNLRVSMIVTMDEEWAAVNGSRKVLEWMHKNGKQPDAFIVGEPSSQDVLGSHIKIGRRGSLVGKIIAQGVQGHAAYQDLFENPNRALTLAAAVLNAHQFKDGNRHFPSTNFECVALNSGNFNASAVIPGSAEMLWNVRFTPEHTPDSIEKLIQGTLVNPPDWAKAHPDFSVLKKLTVVANKSTASMPYYKKPAALAAAVCQAIKAELGIDTQLDGSGGTTDGRFAAQIFSEAEIIELGLPERGGIVGGIKPADYQSKGGMHQVDERASIEDIMNLKRIFERTVLNYEKIWSSEPFSANSRRISDNLYP